MKNKILKYGLIAVLTSYAAIFTLTSCSDFLDIYPQGKVLAETYMNDEATAEKAVVGLYNLLYLTSGTGPDNNWLNNHYDCYFGSMMSDDADKGSSVDDYPDLQLMVGYQYYNTIEFIQSFWVHGFWGVSRANYILDHLQTSTLDQALITKFEGEAHFFRAYYYFYLLLKFGGLPILKNEVMPSDFGNVPRSTFTETIQFIIDELKIAAEKLPTTDRSGRVSKGSAQGLLARVMLYRLGTDPEVGSSDTSWQALYDLTGQIISSGDYSLLPNYATLWEEVSEGNYRQESLFEYAGKGGWSNYASAVMIGEWMFQGVRGGSWYGWGFNQPTQDLFDAFDPTDPRLSSTIYGIGYNNGILYGGTTNFGMPEYYDRGGSMMTNYYNRKVAVNGFSVMLDGTTKAVFVIRYADVLLMRAEAAYYTNNEAEARKMVNLVRERARKSSYCKGYVAFKAGEYNFPSEFGVTPNIPDITSSGEQLLNDIWNERRLELALENFRTYDLIRTGRLLDRVGTVKDDRRQGGSGTLNTTNNAQLEIRIPNIRENITKHSIHVTVPGQGGGERYIPVLAIPKTEVDYWNIDPNPTN